MKSICKNTVIVFILAIALFTQKLNAVIISPYISAQSTATQITEGEYSGWYKYTLVVNWNLCKSLSHWDLILKPGCGARDHIIEFPEPAGSSGSGCHEIFWTGEFNKKGDRSLNPDVLDPVVKYEPNIFNPGRSGSGTFYFISNITPENNGPYPNIVVAKAGNCPDVYGTLTGDYPSCTVTPEPATISLLGLSMLFVLVKKRRRA
jgi:hypothetical protein